MLLGQLVAYAERLEREAGSGEQAAVVPSGYQMQPIRGFIKLDKDGNFLEFYPTDGGQGKRDKGKVFAAPHVMRSSGVKPKLLADNAEYAYGVAKKENDPKTLKRHHAFAEAVRSCFEATQNPSVGSVLNYLTRSDAAVPEVWENFDPNLNYSFEVDGVRPFEQADVQRYWASQVMRGAEAGTSAFVAESLISGHVGTVMEREPIKIKGIPDGQTSGMNFISANAGAFVSYGLEASQIAPVRLEEAEKYANALNRLLSDEKTHLRLGSVAYAFWTKEGDVPPLRDALGNPAESGLHDIFAPPKIDIGSRPQEVREMLKSIWVGRQQLDLRPTDFYAVGLSASGSRVVVRHYIVTTVDEVLGQLAYFYAAQKLTARDAEARAQGIYALAASLYRDFRKESSSHDVDALLAFALAGGRLPHGFLQRLTARNRAEKRVTYPRAVLTKMTLISRGVTDMGKLEELDTSYPDVAYQLGRLLAVLDDVQGSVMRANTTLVDRFYGSMSTTPKAVWGRLMQGTQHHLAKLRKEKPGVYIAKQRMLEEVNSRIHPSEIPGVLSLESQALFSLGYYHQRAAISQSIQAAREAKAIRLVAPDFATADASADTSATATPNEGE